MTRMLLTRSASEVAAHFDVSIDFLDSLHHIDPTHIRHKGMIYESDVPDDPDEPETPEVIEICGVEYSGAALKFLRMDKEKRMQLEQQAKQRAERKAQRLGPNAKTYGRRSTLGRTGPLTPDEVREIKKRLAQGISGRAVARHFRVSPATVRRIRTGQSHRFVTDTPE
ncbi:helix-turn-helix domain-containing protein [Burkholderia multivorans]|uniref:helix-turn-helix domain-containing protein n=1 Tax=Burkholderia multivorans TaxID=87883 RepID=UPI000CFF2FA6|nr:helix-turn-helix domain-containing protein [Burkholderia multivorans]MBU9514467.1 helix-turn-helix domain-containing protein [Burkholderia multivorans]MDN8009187.1 helix-turn-helix domain-containing protein [Burkholderia multivorans]